MKKRNDVWMCQMSAILDSIRFNYLEIGRIPVRHFHPKRRAFPPHFLPTALSNCLRTRQAPAARRPDDAERRHSPTLSFDKSLACTLFRRIKGLAV